MLNGNGQDLPPTSLPPTLAAAARVVLTTTQPAAKVALTARFAAAWQAGEVTEVGQAPPPARPARPPTPVLLPPRDMPRRSTGPKGRVALLHALAHIELNAIDLAWDIIARFTDQALPRPFYDDWVRVAADEGRHFALLADLLAADGAAYGDLPAHDGLWQAAEKTAHDLRARLAVVPLVHEARGLDTTPGSIARLEAHGETALVAALRLIHAEEVTHVAAGARWFAFLAERDGLEPAALYQSLVATHYPGGLKPPLDEAARTLAGFPRAWYAPLVRI